MNNSPFLIERVYDAPVALVWKAISDRDEMKKWYFDISEFEAVPGFKFRFHGENKEGVKFLHLCEVLEAIPGKKLSYSWQYEGEPGYTMVSFELFEEGEKTRIRLTHTGLETLPAKPDYAASNFAEGWTYIIGTALKNYVEKA
jgi:uncharacterized protein YndB with AHSA1/START domain